jgi:uncharacterized protein YjbI with pentapeptide repeats
MPSMTSMQTWPVRVTALGDAVCGTRVWSTQKQLRVTVVVKETFAIIRGGVMKPAPSTPLVVDDEHQGGRTTQSLLAAGELALRLPRVDVWLTGHAYAAPGETTSSALVRLIVGRDGKLLVNKSIRVQGDASDQSSELLPFQYMPLVHERALGGRGSEDNPAGVGLEPGRAPNLLDPRGRPTPACFAPIPRCWPIRNRLLGAFDPGELEAPRPAILEDFDWAYFHAAPADQRIDALRGDEVMILEGMDRALARVETQLPSARAIARLYGPTPALSSGQPIELRADTLGIDCNRQTCTILWRGDFPAEGLDLDALEVIAGVELPDRKLELPSWKPALSSGGTLRLSAADVARQLASRGLPYDREAPAIKRSDKPAGDTIQLRASDVARLTPADALPFGREPAGGRVQPAASARVETKAPVVRAERPSGITSPTLDINPADVARLTAADALPFGREPAGGRGEPAASARVEMRAPVVRAERPSGITSPTLDINPADVARLTAADALPFGREPRAHGRIELPSEPPQMAPPLVSEPPQMAPPLVSEPPRMAPPMPVSPPPLMGAPLWGEPPPAVIPPPALGASPSRSLDPSAVASAVSPPSGAAALPPTGIGATLLERIAAREPLLDLDLSGADLRGLDLAGAVLSRLNLKGADLRDAKLAGARLAGAQLADADLSFADLSCADLSGADLARAMLAKTRLDEAVLTGATLAGARGPGASFVAATATRVSFARGEWDEASFARASAVGADFSASAISGARFEGATLDDARFDDVRGAGAVFDEARLSRARLAGASLVGASLRGVDATGSIWEKATLDRAVFAGANLKEANLGRTNALGASFAKATLGGANLQRLTGDGADFRGAHLEGADLRQAQLHEARFDRAALRTLSAGKADLSRCRFDRADLTGASLRGAKLAGSSFAYAQLDGADLLDADLTGVNVFGASRKTAKIGAGGRGLVEVDPGPEEPEEP